MKERPILFGAPMVHAILDGSKTQTRRALKTQPLDVLPILGDKAGVEWVGLMTRDPEPKGTMFRCKFGQPVDRLWVREAWRLVDFEHCDGSYSCAVEYLADGGRGPRKRGGIELMDERLGGRPSIHMPRWASRINLEITGVRVERLKDISEADAKAEGSDCLIADNCTEEDKALLDLPLYEIGNPYRNGYALLWESINGPGSWDANPWVWVIEFKRAQP